MTNELAEVTRPSSKTAYIRYSPTPEQQKMISSKGVSGLFKVQYDVRRSLDAGDIYVSLQLVQFDHKFVSISYAIKNEFRMYTTEPILVCVIGIQTVLCYK